MTVSRTLASSLSTTHRGTAFEERSLRILEAHLSMSLRRVGGKSDGGIDLLGWWWLPAPGSSSHACSSTAPRRRLRILAQCKAEKKKTSPKYVREMEGVLHRYLVSSPPTSPPTAPLDGTSSVKSPVVGLLISESPFTKSTILRAVSSPIPFFLLHLPPSASCEQDTVVEEAPTWTGTAIWNPALGGGTGLLGGEIEARWERSLSGSGLGRPSLWWRNEKLRSWTPEGEFEELD